MNQIDISIRIDEINKFNFIHDLNRSNSSYDYFECFEDQRYNLKSSREICDGIWFVEFENNITILDEEGKDITELALNDHDYIFDHLLFKVIIDKEKIKETIKEKTQNCKTDLKGLHLYFNWIEEKYMIMKERYIETEDFSHPAPLLDLGSVLGLKDNEDNIFQHMKDYIEKSENRFAIELMQK